MVIHRSAGGLDQEDVAATDGFLNLDVQLTIGKPFADTWAVWNPQIGRDLLREGGIRSPAEQPQPAIVLLNTLLLSSGSSEETGHDAR